MKNQQATDGRTDGLRCFLLAPFPGVFLQRVAEKGNRPRSLLLLLLLSRRSHSPPPIFRSPSERRARQPCSRAGSRSGAAVPPYISRTVRARATGSRGPWRETRAHTLHPRTIRSKRFAPFTHHFWCTILPKRCVIYQLCLLDLDFCARPG